MSTTEPIRTKEEIQAFKQYFLNKGQVRNYVLVTMGLNTSLRIGDLLHLRWGDVYDFQKKCYRGHIVLKEQKTGKENKVALNYEAKAALDRLLKDGNTDNDYLFQSRTGKNQPIGRVCAYKIIRKAVNELHIEGTIRCHSLRKTFGYHAWKKGVPPALIMSIYNHSSIEITKRYLSIDQDDKDQVFLKMNL